MDGLPAGLGQFLIGGGSITTPARSTVRLTIPAKPRGYADAQLDDTQRLARRRFRWTPPVGMSVRARASSASPLGTLGFGFWNDPFAVSLGQSGAARRFPAAPQAAWFFFGSPPNDLAFSSRVSGHGWKAVSLRFRPLPVAVLGPLAAAGFLLSRLPPLRRPVVEAARRMAVADEAELRTPLDEWHTYRLRWQPGQAAFEVDGETVLVAPTPPPGRLGFVTWIDNQYAIASPESGIAFGLLPTDQTQWLELCDLRIEEI